MKPWARLMAVAGIALALAGPLPAEGAVDVWISVQYPPPGASGEEARQWTPREGSVLRGAWKIVVDAGAYSSLKSFSVAIRPEDSSTPSPQGAEVGRSYPAGQKGSDRIEFAWDTGTLTPFNAYYKIVVSAASWVDDQAAQEVSVTRLAVDNPPETPAGVEVALKGGTPVVTWTANREPDLRRYLVLRASGTLPSKQIGATSKTTFTDTNAPQGVSLRYQVVAVRTSALDSYGITSAPSRATPSLTIGAPEVSGAPRQAVEIPAPAPAPVAAARARETVLPRRDLGFAPLLPYSELLPQPPAEDPAIAEGEDEPRTTFISLPSVVAGARMVAKPPFVAAALLLFVAALHVGMAARRLFRAA